MLADLSASELDDWYKFMRHEPIGPERTDYGFALLASILANVNRDPKRRKPFSLDDFLLFEPRVPADPVDLSEQLKTAFAKPE